MTAAENRRRLYRLRAEEAAPKATSPSQSERNYGPERRRQAQINKQRMRGIA